jgi:predicted Zn-dependent protease
VVTVARTEIGLELAERALGFGEEQGADQVEVLYLGEDSALTRFANSEIHQNVAESNATVNVRMVFGKRVGVASTNRLDDEGLRRAAQSAADLSRLQAENPDFTSLPGPAPIESVDGAYIDATASASPEQRAEGARAVIAAAEGLGVHAFGSFSTTVDTLAVATSLGIRAHQVSTRADLSTVSMGDDGEAGWAEAHSADVQQLDPTAVGREAADRAVRSRKATSLEPGDYPVVLDPYAVSDVVESIMFLGFSALAVQEGRSFYEPGRTLGSPLVSIWDDGHDPEGLPLAFDYEGVPKQRVDLIREGAAVDLVYDSYTAGREGKESTGHGLPAPNPWGPFAINLFMAPGDASRDELVRGMAHGLLVTRFHYTNVVHPKRAIITGMTRDGTFLVRDGEIVGPVRNLRFTQSYLDALAGVDAISRERQLLRGYFTSLLVPAVRIGAFTFTGATEF